MKVTRADARIGRVSSLALVSLLAALLPFGCSDASGDRDERTLEPVRHGAIITSKMLPGDDGRNVNGPSLIEAPSWLAAPLGRYYLYFSSHRRARYIRLAHAESITGPWRVYEPGTLRVGPPPLPQGNVGSPEVWVDHEHRQIRMYFNSRDPETQRQATFVATSTNGVDFQVVGGPLGPSYSRAFAYDGWHYLFLGASGQRVLRSRDGLTDWEQGPMVIPARKGPEPYSRHVAVYPVGDTLRVFFTRKRDAPERILMGTIDLTADWLEWRVVGETEILRPEKRWEGARLPVRPSRRGPANRSGENALRDPAVFHEDGRTWLLYTYAGERGIALAELLF